MLDAIEKQTESSSESNELIEKARTYLIELNLKSHIDCLKDESQQSVDIAKLIVLITGTDKASLSKENLLQITHIVNLHHSQRIRFFKKSHKELPRLDCIHSILHEMIKTNLLNNDNLTKLLERKKRHKSMTITLEAIGEDQYNTYLTQKLFDALLESHMGNRTSLSHLAQSIQILLHSNLLTTDRLIEILRIAKPKSLIALLTTLMHYDLLTEINFTRIYCDATANEIVGEQATKPDSPFRFSKLKYYLDIIDFIAKLELPLDQAILDKIISHKDLYTAYIAVYDISSVLQPNPKWDELEDRLKSMAAAKYTLQSAPSIIPWPIDRALILHTILDAPNAHDCSANVLYMLRHGGLTEDSLKLASSGKFKSEIIHTYNQLRNFCHLDLPDLYSYDTESSQQRLCDLYAIFWHFRRYPQITQEHKQRIINHPNLVLFKKACGKLQEFARQYPDQGWLDRFVDCNNETEIKALVKECNDNLEAHSKQKKHQEPQRFTYQSIATKSTASVTEEKKDEPVAEKLLEMAKEKGFHFLVQRHIKPDHTSFKLTTSDDQAKIARHFKSRIDSIIKGKIDIISLLDVMPSELINNSFEQIITQIARFDFSLDEIISLCENKKFTAIQRAQIDEVFLSPLLLADLDNHIKTAYSLYCLFNYLTTVRIEAILPRVYPFLDTLLRSANSFSDISMLPVLNQRIKNIFRAHPKRITDLVDSVDTFVKVMQPLSYKQRRFVFKRRKDSLFSSMSPTIMLRISPVLTASELHPYYDACVDEALLTIETIEEFHRAYVNLPLEFRADFLQRFQPKLKNSILTPVHKIHLFEICDDSDNESLINCFSKNLNLAMQILPLEACSSLINEFNDYWKLMATPHCIDQFRNTCRDLSNTKMQLIKDKLLPYIKNTEYRDHLNSMAARPIQQTKYDSLNQFLACATVVKLNELDERLPQYLDQLISFVNTETHIVELKNALSTDSFTQFTDALYTVLDTYKSLLKEHTGSQPKRISFFDKAPQPITDELAKLNKTNTIETWLAVHASLPCNNPAARHTGLFMLLEEASMQAIKTITQPIKIRSTII